MYCVMRASVPSLYNVYRRYDIVHRSVPEWLTMIVPRSVPEWLAIPIEACQNGSLW